jgi:ankyrin repeat protein
VDVNKKRDDGETPLDKAVYDGHIEIADLLRKHGGKTGIDEHR